MITPTFSFTPLLAFNEPSLIKCFPAFSGKQDEWNQIQEFIIMEFCMILDLINIDDTKKDLTFSAYFALHIHLLCYYKMREQNFMI